MLDKNENEIVYPHVNKSLYEQIWMEVYHKEMPDVQQKISKDLKLLSLTMNKSELHVAMELLEVFADTMDKHNLTYVIDGGSLLGIYRHHGPIPWDDDFDVMANIDEQKKVDKALKSLSPRYVLYKWKGFKDGRWKIYSEADSTQKHKTKPWRWPFLDIFWFKDNGTHILDLYKKNNIKRQDFYPLRKRPFGHLNIYAPCNVSAKLKVNKIDWNMCVSSRINHRKEKWIPKLKKVQCIKLYKYFPFVTRHRVKGGTLEHLMANNKSISTYEEPSCY